MTDFTTEQFKRWGAIGGARGAGKKKRRSKAHYKRISKLGVIARKTK